MELILASTSPYRKAQLESLGLQFTCAKPPIDEDAHKNPTLSPLALCQKLSLLKAQSLSSQNKNHIIIAADQLVNFKGVVLGKPGTLKNCADQLHQLSGKTHELITSLTLLFKDQIHQHTDHTFLTMKSLSLSQCLAYAEQDQPMDCAGGYKIEKAGIGLFSKIETQDFTSIQGLPLMSLVFLLQEIQYPLPFLPT